ncbi:MAG: Spy/CpxP family protein refolding chaperone [candidate division NC10 bacterium]|nr:Spy/CpxP family protein refolding chaperone [candidate division NC10 bacterium]
MRTKGVFATGLALLLASTVPASGQMMGGGSGEMGTTGMMGRGMHGPAMTDCPGMAGQPVAFGSEGPWISIALAYAKDLALTSEQVKGLSALRDAFQREALRLIGEIRRAEAGLRASSGQKPLNLQAVEPKVRAIASLEADLRLARVKTLEEGNALLTPEQQRTLSDIVRNREWMHGALTMGAPPAGIR